MKILDEAFKYEKDVEVCGLTEELSIMYINNFFEKNNKNVIVLTSSLYEANTIYKKLKTYNDECLLFPMDDFLTSVALAISPDFKIKRLEVQEKILNEPEKKHIIVTSLMGYLKYLPNKNEKRKIVITKDEKNISREIIIKELENFGYKKETIVTTTGEYAVRGFIIDIFPRELEHPIRIEFFDEEIEKIKEFDENTQLSIKNIKEVEIRKINENTQENKNSLVDYCGKCTIFKINKNQIEISYKKLQEEIIEYKTEKKIPKEQKYMFEISEIPINEEYDINTLNLYKSKNTITYSTKEIINFNSDFEKLKNFCAKELKSKTIIFTTTNEKQRKELKKLFADALVTTENKILKNKINIIDKKINRGFIIDDYIVISPYDIDKVEKIESKYKNNIKIGKRVKTYTDLKIGDYIVHEAYGIGIYNGLKTLKTNGCEKDYIELLYIGNDKVYIPVEKIDRIFKYTESEGRKPKLDKLNSSSWARKKLEVRKKIEDISGELLDLYTKRTVVTSTPYKDYEDEVAFSLTFPYTLTDDQEKTIKEISEDLKKSYPMDRLLCGDVGYGKTEVAFRAMFKAVINGFQVAYLCPTTILSKQQYNNAVARFNDFGISVELLNRHISAKKTNEIIKKLESGTIDIIIGTHKLLNDKIKYKNLGLLIVDEEQRFGVKHKEEIKKLKNDINVLTLSATPIPRTLKMAMSGLKAISVLDTPPINRYPIQTYVLEENDLIMRDAIYKEMARNGQVYILINSIESINTFASKLQKIVPEARIVTAHGKMSSKEINDIMEKFIDKEYDILVCTTIIETGIDISNVNTIIIKDADRFGLSQLYQIRGRVGRSDKIAYAYLMYKPAKVLTETAVKRLNSIKEFTELGSGYKIAMRDLAIRGAGDLLGKEQAGFIDAIGLDLYTRLVNDEIKRLQGESVEEESDDNKTALFDIATHIDDKYVEEQEIKIEIHKLISTIKTPDDYEKVKTELKDRFGEYDEKIEIYMLEKLIEEIIKELKIEVYKTPRKITLELSEENSNKVDGEKLFIKALSINPKFLFSYKNKKIQISLIIDNLSKNYIYYIFDLINMLNTTIKKV